MSDERSFVARSRAWIKATGGDPDKVTYKEIPHPRMEDALRQKQVDAGYMVIPYVALATAKPEFTAIAHPYSAVQLGVDNALKIFVISLACFFPVFLNTPGGIGAVDDVLLQTARTFRISGRKTLLSVVLPASLPMIAAGIRTATGIALVVTVIAEMIAGSSGLGYYIIQMQYALKPEAMYAAVICLAATGYLLNRLVLLAETHFVPWIGK